MPHSQYIPGTEPPSLWDRVLFNPYGTALGLMALVLGAVILVSSLTDLEVSRSLAEAPVLLQILIGSGLFFGGTLSLCGIFHPRKKVSRLRAMTTELLGAIPIATGALAYGVGVIGSLNSYAIVTVIISLGIGSAYLLRAWALHKSEGRVRGRIEAETRLKG